MKPLLVLLITFAIATFAIKFITHTYDIALAARLAMAVMLAFTAIAHFVFTKGMTMMMPDFIPYKKAMVYITGVIEVLAGIGLLIPAIQLWAAWLVIAFFIAILPANINAAIRHIDYQKATYEGESLNYLWFRIPLQLFFIAWVYFSAIK